MQECTNGQGPRQRSFDNNWDDAVLGEIELGSMQAYMAMACDFDVGVNGMEIWFIFETDERAERGLPPTNETPWGPMYDERVFERRLDDWMDPDGDLRWDEERARAQAEADEDRRLDRELRRRP